MNEESLQSGGQDSAIAVIGLACRFPGARSREDYWRNLRDGVESIRRLSDDDLRAEGVDEATLADPRYVKACADLQDMEMFDAGFFGFSPKEAAILDPQHRHFLECAWEALEDAGHVPESFDGAIGVFAGCGMNAYFTFNLLSNPDLVKSVGLFLLRHTGNDKDFLATRASYCMNLTGPSVSVQTACSTSLVAIHMACQHLLSGECDMALAGGATVELPHRRGYLYEEGEILSPDGHCRAFDAAAKGTVFGSGAGVIVLCRLADALAGGDTIHAVILGSAINNDGSSKVGYLAPSVDGQAKAVLEALAVAGVRADTVTYVEAHGTGTPVGDPIEVAALAQAFRSHTAKRGFCGIGSVKSNIGHTDTAAGVASFIKVVEALEHRQIPPSLHYEAPNPAIDFESSPFRVNSELREWTMGGFPRRAGVSSLGVGGTNAHVVVEEAPAAAPGGPGKGWKLLVLSARSEAALDAAAERLARRLDEEPALEPSRLADVSYTLQTGRKAFAHRRAVAVKDAADAAAALRSGDAKRVVSGACRDEAPSVVFLFPGGGAQYPDMGLELYREEPVYRAEVDRCLALLERREGIDLRPHLFPRVEDRERAARELERPLHSILSVFVVEHALARLWQSWGIRPAAMTGHSLGEYAAACVAGVFSLEDALVVVRARGEIFERMPAGAMLSVPVAEAELRALLGGRLSIAAVNGPGLCVASGCLGEVEALERTLVARGVEAKRLHISVAAHSAALEPFLEEFARRLEAVELRPPEVPFVSNLTGTWAKASDVTDRSYWVRHLRSTVRFSDGLRELLVGPGRFLLEVGPGTTLGSLARAHVQGPGGPPIAASMRHPQEAASDLGTIYATLGRLWVAGAAVDWQAFHGEERRRRVPLPAYPFEHERYWIEARAPVSAGAQVPAEPVRVDDMDSWFSRPVWRRKDRPAAGRAPRRGSRWLVFAEEGGVGRNLAGRLEALGHEVFTVEPAGAFERRGERSFALGPASAGDHVRLVRELAAGGRFPERVAHLWLAGDAEAGAAPLNALESALERGFWSVLCLAQALGSEDVTTPVHMDLVTRGMQRACGEAAPCPERALLLGPAKVLPREHPNLTCRAVDIDGAGPAGLLAELLEPAPGEVVALRGGARWVQGVEPLRLEGPAGEGLLRDRGVYLITGGLGGIGRAVAEHLARSHRARLALVGRRPPAAAESAVRAIEALGGEALVLAADVSDPRALREAVEAARRRFGPIHGAFHAAGVVDDGPAQLKERAAAERVLAPKVKGTLALEAALAGEPLDVLVLFSSTSALLGLPGQVDYAAANAFLDAFARSRAGRERPRTVAVSWGVWRDVGIAARAVAGGGGAGAAHAADTADTADTAGASPPRHPLLGRRADAPGKVSFSAGWRAEDLWVLDHHRLRTGEALLPGTAFIEIARAAFEEAFGPGPVDVRDLVFLAPLQVEDCAVHAVRVELSAEEAGHAFAVSSAPRSAEGGPAAWTEHARGTVARGAGPAPAKLAAAQISGRCTVGEALFGPSRETRQERHLRFGPRWKGLLAVRYGRGEALATLELLPELAGDLDLFETHPALLDLATACGLPLLAGYERFEGLYVPFTYKRVRILGPLSRRVYAHVRCAGEADASRDAAAFDVTVADEGGRVLVEVEELTLRRLGEEALAALRARGARAAATPGDAPGAGLDLLRGWVRQGIAPAEGVRALDRILAGVQEPQVVVSSMRLDALLAQVARARPRGARKVGSKARRAAAYVAPADDLEKALAGMWQELLGVEQVGANDDFFALGGHSLIAVRLVNRIEKSLKLKLRLPDVFEAPTVAGLAARLREARKAPARPAAPEIIPVAREAHRQRRSALAGP